jgi:hypothetical protein
VELAVDMPETVVLQHLQRHPQLKFAELDHRVAPVLQSGGAMTPWPWRRRGACACRGIWNRC